MGFCAYEGINCIFKPYFTIVFLNYISQLYFSTVFLNFEILAWMVSAQRNGEIKCKKKATAADCLQGAEGQTAPGVTNQKLMIEQSEMTNRKLMMMMTVSMMMTMMMMMMMKKVRPHLVLPTNQKLTIEQSEMTNRKFRDDFVNFFGIQQRTIRIYEGCIRLPSGHEG